MREESRIVMLTHITHNPSNKMELIFIGHLEHCLLHNKSYIGASYDHCYLHSQARSVKCQTN